jgi:hypothetical protein
MCFGNGREGRNAETLRAVNTGKVFHNVPAELQCLAARLARVHTPPLTPSRCKGFVLECLDYKQKWQYFEGRCHEEQQVQLFDARIEIY